MATHHQTPILHSEEPDVAIRDSIALLTDAEVESMETRDLIYVIELALPQSRKSFRGDLCDRPTLIQLAHFVRRKCRRLKALQHSSNRPLSASPVISVLAGV